MRRMYSKPQLLEAIEQEAQINGLKAFENIVDKDGHKRFIEGNITLETITGVTQTYGKWSLSGSHLLIVVSGSIANTTAISSSTLLAKINLPEWIFNKIIPLYGNNLDYHNTPIFNSSGQTQTMGNYLAKGSSYLELRTSSITLTDNRSFRFAFDLLIDNE